MKSIQYYDIAEISRKVTPIARQYGVAKVSLFGSYAVGAPTSDSDLDFRIVDRGSLRGLIQLAGFQLALEDSFGMPVDLLTDDALSEEFRDRIAPHEVVVYEQ
ncbi:MAG: nucleotidyltransferase domain-containing protein [Coriobacteriales bacterium]|jgi:predicted nucleotidyltransferase|nr:nucleotidyltransferase domain-containing protein [Coriobacteriales bacterium]